MRQRFTVITPLSLTGVYGSVNKPSGAVQRFDPTTERNLYNIHDYFIKMPKILEPKILDAVQALQKPNMNTSKSNVHKLCNV
ncbi:hypothetical protein [Coxiella endosymbiont of Amblyomma nuttalli]|uniref:hypothetical protein n=1 Tax=Coxiella endosymbiont of Amblyomma nuttalli TaxID=2749996 RepID=UPI001BA8D6E3|nr:hypothetical protein [Coxiella endosymbiont of Amblyomma nuttalli]QTS83559.1 hypothetical protein CEAn_00009 [Coxiella endosymbiont of Amblyomma nuttalli]